MGRADVIRPVLDEALSVSGLVLDDLSITAAGRRSVVRVVLDRDLGEVDEVTEAVEPLSLDEVAEASRLVGDALDRSDVLGEQPYTLEVSSPGVGRPLTEPRHFRRNVGRLVAARTGDREITGRVVRADSGGVTLDVPATTSVSAHVEKVAYADIAQASVQVEFSRPDDHQEN
ncbi:MAG: ribosome maturation factor RimP [Dermatophilaceae bacterium]